MWLKLPHECKQGRENKQEWRLVPCRFTDRTATNRCIIEMSKANLRPGYLMAIVCDHTYQ